MKIIGSSEILIESPNDISNIVNEIDEVSRVSESDGYSLAKDFINMLSSVLNVESKAIEIFLPRLDIENSTAFDSVEDGEYIVFRLLKERDKLTLTDFDHVCIIDNLILLFQNKEDRENKKNEVDALLKKEEELKKELESISIERQSKEKEYSILIKK